jgi:hypothetical protein
VGLNRRFVVCAVLAIGATYPAGTRIAAAAAIEQQPAEVSTLWRDLRASESMHSVAAKVAAYPEVQSVREKPGKGAKPPSLDIKMRKGGISVFGSSFAIRTEFNSLGQLTQVLLVSEAECASNSTDKGRRIAATLEEKYGSEVTQQRRLDDAAISSALLRAYQSEKTEPLTYGYANQAVAVAFVLAFTKSKRPSYVGGNAISRGLSELAISIWESQRKKCNNTGDEEVTYALAYLPRAEFDRQAAELDDRHQRENTKAKTAF